jgi:hypothetical protein
LNVAYDFRVCANSPFQTWRPDFLTSPEGTASEGIVAGGTVSDLAWLYMNVLDYKYIVVHRPPPGGAPFGDPNALARLEAWLADAKVYEDPAAAVYARSRLAPPSAPVALCGAGWLAGIRPGSTVFAASRLARLSVYNPKSDQDLTFAMLASAAGQPRWVCLYSGGEKLCEWRVDPRERRTRRQKAWCHDRAVNSLR